MCSNKQIRHAIQPDIVEASPQGDATELARRAHDRQGPDLDRASAARPYYSGAPLNLACEYCNEYDDFSKPVPTETMFRRVDKLAELGTSVITISGGEPLLHPHWTKSSGAFGKPEWWPV